MPTVNPLGIALSGLRVSQAQIGVTSNNISNVSTDGYSRKTLQQYSTVIGGEGSGVSVGNIQRRIDEILLKDYRSQISLTTGLTTRQSYLNQVQEFHGPPDSEQSISAELGKLKNTFSQLANQPENSFLLTNVYNKAQQVAQKFNDFSARLVEMRNNAQTEMQQSVSRVNALTEQIAELNTSIKVSTSVGRPTADMEDQRDLAVRELAKEIDISYFKDSGNCLNVMTKNGQLLADTTQTKLTFNPSTIGAQTYYPVSVAAVKLGNAVTGTDVTSETALGGRLGALITLRDDTLPVYQAQVDELAHKTALRFESQGLKLFTLPNGTIPVNNPTAYNGFAADMTVNPAITVDQTLIRKGTAPGSTVQNGSSEVLRKIIEFAFGNVEYEQVTGTVDISNAVPTLFTTLGITAQARLQANANIQSLGSLDSSPAINPGVEDTFSIQVGAAAPINIVIGAGDTAADLINTINASYPGMATLGTGGELVLKAGGDITIGAGTLGPLGLAELGLTAGVTASVNPSFSLSVGKGDIIPVEILPTDTSASLLTKLNALSGITASLTVDGYLRIVPKEGGDITLVDGLGGPLAALGASETNVAHAAFNVTGLGPGASLNSRIQTGTTLQDYATQAISIQSQDAENVDLSLSTEDNYRATLENEFLDSTGVNLDEEMANLISIQTAYNASARTISIVEEMMDELMNAFR